jgi:hypothetical protein
MAGLAQRVIVVGVGGLLLLAVDTLPMYAGSASRTKPVSVTRSVNVTTDLGGRRRYHWRRPSLILAPVVGVVGGDVATTELASRHGYYNSYYGYYGGPAYYGGPYYNPPFYDGVSDSYFRTHPIVEW